MRYTVRIKEDGNFKLICVGEQNDRKFVATTEADLVLLPKSEKRVMLETDIQLLKNEIAKKQGRVSKPEVGE